MRRHAPASLLLAERAVAPRQSPPLLRCRWPNFPLLAPAPRCSHWPAPLPIPSPEPAPSLPPIHPPPAAATCPGNGTGAGPSAALSPPFRAAAAPRSAPPRPISSRHTPARAQRHMPRDEPLPARRFALSFRVAQKSVPNHCLTDMPGWPIGFKESGRARSGVASGFYATGLVLWLWAYWALPWQQLQLGALAAVTSVTDKLNQLLKL